MKLLGWTLISLTVGLVRVQGGLLTDFSDPVWRMAEHDDLTSPICTDIALRAHGSSWTCTHGEVLKQAFLVYGPAVLGIACLIGHWERKKYGAFYH